MTLIKQIQAAAIGQIEKADIPALIAIADRCGLTSWSNKNFIDELARRDSIMLRLMHPDIGIVGFMVGRVIGHGSGNSMIEAEVYNIGVDKEFQGLGFGQRLFDAFLERCKKANASQIWLEVRASNKGALAFYERNKFVKYSVRKAFYSHPTENAVIMCRKVENTGIS